MLEVIVRGRFPKCDHAAENEMIIKKRIHDVLGYSAIVRFENVGEEGEVRQFAEILTASILEKDDAATWVETFVNAVMEVFEVSPADMAVILERVRCNVNPYVAPEDIE